MKRIVILGLSVLLLAGGVLSCKKTSKGKMANEWSVAEFNSEYTSTDDDGEEEKTVVSLNGSVLNTTETYTTNLGSVSIQGVKEIVNTWTYTIDKDGTWSSLQDITTTELDSVFNFNTFEFDTFISENKVISTSGVWNFIGKSKVEDFKKNERVVFNILSEGSTRTKTITPGVTVVTSSKETYNAGSYAIIYTVMESKKKELTLESLIDYSDTDGSEIYKAVDLATMTLTQK